MTVLYGVLKVRPRCGTARLFLGQLNDNGGCQRLSRFGATTIGQKTLGQVIFDHILLMRECTDLT